MLPKTEFRQKPPAHISPENVNQNNLLEFCKQEFSAEEYSHIQTAWTISEEAHRGVKRETGEPYVTHPREAAIILIKEIGWSRDWRAIVAALLHDTVEDAGYWASKDLPNNQIIIQSMGSIDSKFKDEEVADMIFALTKLRRRNRDGKKYQFEKDAYITNLAGNLIAVLIKAADRLHNLRTLPQGDRTFAISQIQDTENYILPCLEYVYREDRRVFSKCVDKAINLLGIEIESVKRKFDL